MQLEILVASNEGCRIVTVGMLHEDKADHRTGRDCHNDDHRYDIYPVLPCCVLKLRVLLDLLILLLAQLLVRLQAAVEHDVVHNLTDAYGAADTLGHHKEGQIGKVGLVEER